MASLLDVKVILEMRDWALLEAQGGEGLVAQKFGFGGMIVNPVFHHLGTQQLQFALTTLCNRVTESESTSLALGGISLSLIRRYSAFHVLKARAMSYVHILQKMGVSWVLWLA
jgi:hypothetical protein